MLRSRGLETVLDLLYHLPFRYEDRRQIKEVRNLVPGEKVTVLARVERGSASRVRKGALGLFEATLSDGRGTLEARWFNNNRLADVLVPGVRVALFGKVESEWRNRPLMVQPEFEILHDDEEDESLHTGRVVPIYEAIVKISTRIFRTLFHRRHRGLRVRTKLFSPIAQGSEIPAAQPAKNRPGNTEEACALVGYVPL